MEYNKSKVEELQARIRELEAQENKILEKCLEQDLLLSALQNKAEKNKAEIEFAIKARTKLPELENEVERLRTKTKALEKTVEKLKLENINISSSLKDELKVEEEANKLLRRELTELRKGFDVEVDRCSKALGKKEKELSHLKELVSSQYSDLVSDYSNELLEKNADNHKATSTEKETSDVSSLEDTISKLEIEKEESKDIIETLQTQCMNLRSTLELETTILKQDNETLVIRCNALQETCNSLQERLDLTLANGENDSKTKTEDESEEATAQIKHLFEKIDMDKVSIQRLEMMCDKMRKDNSVLESQLEDKVEKFKNLQIVLERKEIGFAESVKKSEELGSIIEAKDQEIQNLLEELQAKQNELDQYAIELSKTQASLKEFCDQNEAYRVSVSKSNDKSEELETENQRLNNEIKGMEAKINESENKISDLNEQTRVCMMALDDANERCQNLEEKLSEKIKALNRCENSLQKTRDDLESAKSEIEIYQKTSNGLETRLAEKTNEIEQVKELGSARLIGIEQATERYNQLEREFEALNERKAASDQKFDESTSIINSLENEVDRSKEWIKSLEIRLAQSDRNLEKAENEKDTINIEHEKALRTLQKEKSDVLEALNQIENKNLVISKQIDDIRNGKNPFSWAKVHTPHLPPPPYGLNSAVIQFLLRSWSKDEKKIAHVNQWCGQIINGEKVEKQRVLQLNGLTTEIREGIMKLIVPLLQQRNDLTILVHSQPVVNSDVLIDISPKPLE
uniref:Uncharacterized protein n=1 Tax=Aplanochytrium stocchinoi TaxID=215587 RepID=A0A7S3PHG9_9STRA